MCSASSAPSIAARRTIRRLTRIGNDNLFMAYTHVAHDCLLGNHIVMANYAALAGHVQIGRLGASSAGSSAVHQFCKIGAHAFIANNAGVTRDVPPYIWQWASRRSRTRSTAKASSGRGFTPEQIRNIRNAYRILYRRTCPSLRRSSASGPRTAQPEIAPFVEFIARIEPQSIVR